MSNLNLEIGGTYVYKSKSGRLMNTRIVGTVYSDTVEYKRDFRFFSETSTLYKPDGIAFVEYRSLLRESKTEDMEEISLYVKKYSEEDLKDPEKFIPQNSPKFKMTPGSVYINRFGFPIIVNASMLDFERDIVLFSSPGYPNSFDSNGRLLLGNVKDLSSMHDITHQRI